MLFPFWIQERARDLCDTMWIGHRGDGQLPYPWVMGWHDRTGCGDNVTQQKNLCSCLSAMFSHACRGVGQHIAKEKHFHWSHCMSWAFDRKKTIRKKSFASTGEVQVAYSLRSHLIDVGMHRPYAAHLTQSRRFKRNRGSNEAWHIQGRCRWGAFADVLTSHNAWPNYHVDYNWVGCIPLLLLHLVFFPWFSVISSLCRTSFS
jgi:hypothetical protein